jgi:hypothetical protein
MRCAYVLFETPTDGMRLRGLMKERRIDCQICPTPRDLADSCGIALRFSPDRRGEVEALAEGGHIPIRIVRREP